MSAPSIPNLLALRGSRGRGRGRGRAGGTGPGTRSRNQEAVVQGTDTDAAVSRLSAVQLGYLDDVFAPYFVSSADGPAPRRLPIINRGTYTRTTALDALVESFLQQGGDTARQIVSLGAGTDTRPFRLFARGVYSGLIYHEIDFANICEKKMRTVQSSPVLSSILPGADCLPRQEESVCTLSWGSSPRGGSYFCHGVNLAELTPDVPITNIPGLRSDVPTLVLSECCLCYLPPAQASDALGFFTRHVPDLAVAIYEPIRPHDPFGQMMVSNLAARGITMPTLEAYPDGPSQEMRLRKAGLDVAGHRTVENIWQSWVIEDEKERVDGLEGLDEVEEWKLLAAHYVVVWGARGSALGPWVGGQP